MKCIVNEGAVNSCSSVDLIGERSGSLFFSTYDWNVCIASESHPLHSVLFWQHSRCGRKQEKHMGLHPDNRVWFQRAPGHSHGSGHFFLLPGSSPAAVALVFPEYKPLLPLSFWPAILPGKLRPTALPSHLYVEICKWKWSSYFSHSQDSCEDPPRKLQPGRAVKWYKSLMGYKHYHSTPSLRDAPGPAALGDMMGRPWLVSMGCRCWCWEDTKQPVLVPEGISTSSQLLDWEVPSI